MTSVNRRFGALLRLNPRVIAKWFGVSPHSVRMFMSLALSSLFSSLIFLPFLSLTLFVVYMAHYQFFSYDFFTEGVFGMKLFFLAMVAGLIIISLVLFGSVILYFAKRAGFDISWKVIIPIILLNLFFLFLVLRLADPEGQAFTWFVLGIALYLAIHFILFFTSLKTKVRGSVSLFIVAFGSVVMLSGLTAEFLGSGLRAFGMGGEIPIEILSDGEIVKGKLILLTPKYVYFKEGLNGPLTFQALEKVKEIRHVAQPKT